MSFGGVVGRILSAAVVAAILVVAATVVRVWQVARQDHRPTSDVIVVLGAAQYNGTPSDVFEARLQHALDLYQEGVAPRVMTVGGGQEGDNFTEGEAGAQWLREHEIPADAVVPVGEGSDTLESMRAAGDVFAENSWQTAVLVTDPWHELRSEKMAEGEGIDATTSPTRSGPAGETRGEELRYIARETAAYLYYRVFGHSYDAGPDVS